ncbi:3 beta-hydroxysteroid dehydrogenase/delta 5--_4-isomerase [mine drainage metagenome]|uniref:3 beta-hydroxysteroid dehydrogenase/delta 5-->4-isomerase n=1 Tax=mine drainage metagenome TaxID=410659 RepID=A0A1J5RKW5_9ZZZZ
MKILVTGANGFVGRSLCAHLTGCGHAVRPALRETVGDIGPDTEWGPALEGMEAVVHLAARVHSPGSPDSEYQRVNVEGTRRLAQAMAARGGMRLVFASTIKVNGEQTAPGRPFRPDDRPAPEDAYGRSKWQAEQILCGLSAQKGLGVTVLRPPLLYGPGVKGNLLSLMKAIRAGLPLPLASLNNRRSLLNVENFSHAIRRALEASPQGFATYLLSDGEDLSTAQLAAALARALGRTPRLLPCPPAWLRLAAGLAGRPGAARRLTDSLQVDNSAFCRDFDWQPPQNVTLGLEQMARHLLKSYTGQPLK